MPNGMPEGQNIIKKNKHLGVRVLKVISIILCILFLQSEAWAGKILRKKGRTVIVDVRGKSVQQGDKLSVFFRGKKRGVLRVSKINRSGSKAMAKVIMGKANKGWMAELENEMMYEPQQAASKKRDAGKKMHWGAMFGISQDSASVSTLEEDLSGSGLSLLGTLDYGFTSSIQLRAKAGLKQFKTEGTTSTSNCSGESNCVLDINYLNFEGMGQYYLNDSRYAFWLGAGAVISHPISDDTNVVDSDTIETTSGFQLGGGVDIGMQKGAYIPVEISYVMMNTSDDVEPSYLSITFGYMF